MKAALFSTLLIEVSPAAYRPGPTAFSSASLVG